MLDSNILVYAANKDAAEYERARDLVIEALKGSLRCCICPQVLYEFYATVTRTEGKHKLPNPLRPPEALQVVEEYLAGTAIGMITRGPQTLRHAIGLLKLHSGVKAQLVHDLVLVATMLDNGVTKLYTANTKDFQRFSSFLTVRNPLDA